MLSPGYRPDTISEVSLSKDSSESPVAYINYTEISFCPTSHSVTNKICEYLPLTKCWVIFSSEKILAIISFTGWFLQIWEAPV